MFRDDYKQVNDSIRAPKSILAAMQTADAKQSDSLDRSEETDSLILFPQKRRVWPKVIGFSGAAVAVAVLAILTFVPFRSRNLMQKAAEAPQTAESNVITMEAAVAEESDAAALGATLFQAKAAPAPAEAPQHDVGEDNETDEYVPVPIPEITYEDVFASLMFSDENRAETSFNTTDNTAVLTVPTIETAEAEASNADPYGLEEDGYAAVATVVIGERICLMEQNETVVRISMYEPDGDAYRPCGSAQQSGQFVSYEESDATLFDDDNQLVTYHAILLTTRYTPDSSSVDASDPATFIPSVSDDFGNRMLKADEIQLYDASNTFTVYTAVAVSDPVRILYTFAELGLN